MSMAQEVSLDVWAGIGLSASHIALCCLHLLVEIARLERLNALSHT